MIRRDAGTTIVANPCNHIGVVAVIIHDAILIGWSGLRSLSLQKRRDQNTEFQRPGNFTRFVRNRTKRKAFAPKWRWEEMVGMGEWFRGKRVLIVDEDYVAASRLETRLLHCGALVVGPVSSSDEAFRCLVNEEVDAAVLSPAPNLGTSVMISDVLSRLGIPFVFLSREPVSRISDRYGNLVVGKPGKAETIARLLAQTAASAQDNIPSPTRHARNDARGKH